MQTPTATLSCRCGACRIALVDPRPRARSECYCHDCRQRGLIAAGRDPANALPAAVRRFERGIDLYYFANALVVDDDACALLAFSKLRADANNTTAMAACCGTLMCGVHPAYLGHSISVNADSCRLQGVPPLANQVVLFGCDIPAAAWQARCARADVPMIYSVAAEAGAPAMVALLTALTTPVDAALLRAPRVTTFEALATAAGVRLDDSCFEESRAMAASGD
ncbi:MAG: hypothetical protein K2Y51_05965 [Gammaproteobacteria bacterium]|nr:hypothetical protein [Gammaproteobacteria bacterium]